MSLLGHRSNWDIMGGFQKVSREGYVFSDNWHFFSRFSPHISFHGVFIAHFYLGLILESLLDSFWVSVANAECVHSLSAFPY